MEDATKIKLILLTYLVLNIVWGKKYGIAEGAGLLMTGKAREWFRCKEFTRAQKLKLTLISKKIIIKISSVKVNF